MIHSHRVLAHASLLAVLLAACSSSSGSPSKGTSSGDGGGASSGGGSSGDGGSSGSGEGGSSGGGAEASNPPPCDETGFASTATSFALPSLEKPLVGLDDSAVSCPTTGFQAWSTIDMTGDGKPDLVLTQSCADAAAGTTHWLVYQNTGSGFASTATTFALPSLEKPLVGLDNSAVSCPTTGFQAWSTVDMTGDGKPDLVLMQSCSDAAVGTTHWLVYANSGSGFASTATSFALPSVEKPLVGLYDAAVSCPTTGFQAWSTVDMTGDGKPDLVLTESCTDAAAGTTHWLVYANTGSGFASTAASFALPSLERPLVGLDDAAVSCPTTGFQAWSTVDMTGDGKPDLVLTESCSDAAAGTSHWLVYANTGSGFAATATTFALPSVEKPLVGLYDAADSCSTTGFQAWSTIDVTGDGKPDLVLTESCTDATTGTTHWLVYANDGSGFASTATSFALPSVQKPLVGLDDSAVSCPTKGFQAWSTVDMTGDGRLDLVLTQSCADATVGMSTWAIYPGTCAP